LASQRIGSAVKNPPTRRDLLNQAEEVRTFPLSRGRRSDLHSLGVVPARWPTGCVESLIRELGQRPNLGTRSGGREFWTGEVKPTKTKPTRCMQSWDRGECLGCSGAFGWGRGERLVMSRLGRPAWIHPWLMADGPWVVHWVNHDPTSHGADDSSQRPDRVWERYLGEPFRVWRVTARGHVLCG
jgi:hypothetical protein